MVVALVKLKGIDENGNNISTAVVTGKCYASVATASALDKVRAAFPELEVTYGQLKPTPVTTFTFSSSASKTLTNVVFTCSVDYDRVNDYTYKVAVEDGTTVNVTFKADNHEEISKSYLTAGTRTQNYSVTYIPLRTIRVKVYNQSLYLPGATVIVNDKSYISDSNGYIYHRGGEAVSGSVSVYGYAGNTFSYSAITNDSTHTVEVYAAVDVKFVVKSGAALIVGATIKSGLQTGTTNQYGECTLSLGKGTHEYQVTHSDYFTVTGSVTVGTSAMTVNVAVLLNPEVLKPVENGNIQMMLIGTAAVLNITSTTSDYVIDWGDGTSDNATGTGAKTYNHTYESSDLYQVEISNSENITACKADSGSLIAYWSIGDSNVSNLSFGNYSKLSYVGLVFKNDANRTSFYQCFISCSSLTSIPTGLFDNCPAVTEFVFCFYQCSSLTSIPAGLFDNCSAVTNFNICFSSCTSLTSIPTGLFDNCPAVTGFYQCFSSCRSLASIPTGLFDNCPAVTNFSTCFSSCISLTSIPTGLFDNCPTVTNFSTCFSYCRKLITFISNLTKVDSSMFNGCNALILLQITNSTVVPMANTDALAYTNSALQIKVPAVLVDSYKVATNWVSFASKISAI